MELFLVFALCFICLGSGTLIGMKIEEGRLRFKPFDAYKLSDIFMDQSRSMALDGYSGPAKSLYRDAMSIRAEEDERIAGLLTDGDS